MLEVYEGASGLVVEEQTTFLSDISDYLTEEGLVDHNEINPKLEN